MPPRASVAVIDARLGQIHDERTRPMNRERGEFRRWVTCAGRLAMRVSELAAPNHKLAQHRNQRVRQSWREATGNRCSSKVLREIPESLALVARGFQSSLDRRVRSRKCVVLFVEASLVEQSSAFVQPALFSASKAGPTTSTESSGEPICLAMPSSRR
jgi:hypothetical protein